MVLSCGVRLLTNVIWLFLIYLYHWNLTSSIGNACHEIKVIESSFLMFKKVLRFSYENNIHVIESSLGTSQFSNLATTAIEYSFYIISKYFRFFVSIICDGMLDRVLIWSSYQILNMLFFVDC